MLPISILAALLLFGCTHGKQWNHWQNGNRGSAPHSPVLAVNSGKLFFVAAGDLWENYWAGSTWKWWKHGRPNNALADMKPCAIGHKVFVITRSGELWERYYHNNKWQWVGHRTPAGQQIKPTGCATITSPRHSVYVVGRDRQVYERTYTHQWVWRMQQSLPNWEMVSDASIDTIDCPGCTSSVYVVTLQGNIYKISTNGGSWQSVPVPNAVQSIAAAHTPGGGLFFVTHDNQICEEIQQMPWYRCYVSPPGTSSWTPGPVTISRPLRTTDCAGLFNARYLFVNSWSPATGRRGRVTRLQITNNHQTYQIAADVSKDLVGAPEMVAHGSCLKAFNMRNGGVIDQFSWQ